MKKVLVTGASGTIGYQVIKYLLSEGKYEIAALDLKNNQSISKLKKYKKRINIIYGDVTNRVLIEALVKDFDIVIHLAGVSLPLANLKENLAQEIDYKGTENIVRAINYYNPKCHLLYPSSMFLYGNNNEITVKSNLKINKDNYYEVTKKKCEDLIKEKIKNYTIYRFPFILGLVKDSLILNGDKNKEIYYITKEDAAYSLVKSLNYLNEVNKKIFNVTDGDKVLYGDILNNVLALYGLSWKYLFNRVFLDKISLEQTCLDNDELENIINYRMDNIDKYYNRLENAGKRRKCALYIGKSVVKDN